jgi:NADP-dependent 3-hydroxy acid dehydrogenase YdfG
MTAAGVAPTELVLASGGARGITARCVVELARRYGWSFVLIGRTAADGLLPQWASAATGEAELKRRIADELAAAAGREGLGVRPVEIQRRYDEVRARLEIAATLQAVAEAGGQAEYVSADVAGPGLRERLAPAIARLGGVVGGILHGAGALADRKLEEKRAADFDRVFGPKVRGLTALLDAVDLDALRFVALFSSAAGFYGNAGQADYALANEVLNKAAHRLRARLPRCRVIAFDWGPWGGGEGMVDAGLQRQFEERGVGLVPPDAGARVLAEALAPDAKPPPQLLVGSLRPPTVPLEAHARAHRIVRRLDVESNPFLRDHVLGGRPVLPVTCAMAWIADACEGRYPGLHAVRLEECRVLGGVVLDEVEELELVLELTETARSAERGELRVRAEITGGATGGRAQPHYRADVVLARERPAAPNAPPPLPPSTADESDGSALYRDGTLFHGPAFQGVRRVLAFDEGGLSLECRLPAVPEHVQGRFRAGTVNPYVADALFQGVVVWARRTHAAASLPVATASAELYRPLEFDQRYSVSVAVRESAPHRLLADIAAADGDGRIHLRLTGAEIAISPTLARLFVPAAVA